jgi:hypothetical protein
VVDGAGIEARNTIMVAMDDLAESDQKELEKELEEEMAEGSSRRPTWWRWLVPR